MSHRGPIIAAGVRHNCFGLEATMFSESCFPPHRGKMVTVCSSVALINVPGRRFIKDSNYESFVLVSYRRVTIIWPIRDSRPTAAVARYDIVTRIQGQNVLSCEVYIYTYLQKIHTCIMILLKIY